jgi:hypothetical protein
MKFSFLLNLRPLPLQLQVTFSGVRQRMDHLLACIHLFVEIEVRKTYCERASIGRSTISKSNSPLIILLLSEMNLDLQTINEILKSEIEELRIEAKKQKLIIAQNLDVRMGYFGMDMPGSSIGSRASSQSSNRIGKAVNRSVEEIAEIDKAK